MPLYEYECPQCGRFELIQKFSDVPLLACPTCGKDIQKLLSAPAFQFKGTGWYVTDYARKSGGGAPTGSDAPAGGQASSSDAPKPAPSSAPTSSSAPAPATTSSSSSE